MDQDRDVWEVVVEIVEILVVDHCLVAFVLLCVMRCGYVVRDVWNYIHPGDLELFHPRIVFGLSSCYDEIYARWWAFKGTIDSATRIVLVNISSQNSWCGRKPVRL